MRSAISVQQNPTLRGSTANLYTHVSYILEFHSTGIDTGTGIYTGEVEMRVFHICTRDNSC